MSVANELRDVRRAAGLSQAHVADVAGLTQSRISRTERGARIAPRLDELAAHAAALGLRLSIRLYPAAAPVRDAAQLALLERFRSQLPRTVGWRTEVPVSGPGDGRAWDAIIDGEVQIGVDAETRLHDVQALQRRVELKWRDSALSRLVLLVASTRHNRAVLREHRGALSSTFPLDTAAIMSALRAGQVPAANGIVVI